MPLTGQIKNQLTTQVETVFDAIEAGTAFDTNDWIHDSWAFTSSGRQYVVQITPEGSIGNASVVMRIKRTMLP